MKRLYNVLFALLVALAAGFLVIHHGASPATILTTVLSLGIVGVIVATPGWSSHNFKTWMITAEDADTSTTFAHGFGSRPQEFLITPALQPDTTTPFAWAATWDTTYVTLMKAAFAGSGGAAPTTSMVAEVFGWRAHSAAR
jgi:hypothetical protein